MKAVMSTKYGPSDVLQLREVEKPAPGDDEVLVKVAAASVNFGDASFARGKPFLVRLMGAGLFKPKKPDSWIGHRGTGGSGWPERDSVQAR